MLNGERKIARPLRWGMVGGGRTANVGYKHRQGAMRDNTTYELLAGAFDIDAARGKDFGTNIGVAPERCYADYKTMFAEEAKRPDGIEVVTIATPNGSHYEITKAALNAGLHVICEKPLFFEVEQGEEIKALAEAARDSDVRPAIKAVQQITAEETCPGTYTTLARGKASTADARGYCMMPMFTVGHCYAASDLAPGQPVGQPAVPCDSPKAVAAISRMAEGIADVTLCAGKVGVVMSLKPVRTYCYVTAG